MPIKKFVPAMGLPILFCLGVAFGADSLSVGPDGSGGGPQAAADSTSGNTLTVKDATGAAGRTSTVKILLSVDQDVYGAQFDLLFDQSKLQINPLSEQGVAVGANGSPLTLPVLDEEAITAANSAGKLVVMMLNLELQPMTAGQNKELLAVMFKIDSTAAAGDIPISLANVSLSTVTDTLATEISVTAVSGKITVGAFEPGDVSGDGKINIFDLLALLKVLGGTGTVDGDPDVNADGKVNIFDLLSLLKLLAA